MTDLTQARKALYNLGVPHTEEMDDAQVQAYVSTLIGSLTTFAATLGTHFAVNTAGLVRLFHGLAEVIEPEPADPVTALVERLAGD